MEIENQYCSCKIGESCWRCELEDLPSQIGEYWTGPQSESWSISEITNHLNRQFISNIHRQNDVELLAGEAELYRSLLLDETVSEGTREEARGRLKRNGINVESLENMFVTRTTTYRHMQNCLGIEYESPNLTTEETVSQLGKNLDQFRTSIKNILTKHGQNERDFRASVDVNIVCEKCGKIHDAFAYIKQNGCDCNG